MDPASGGCVDRRLCNDCVSCRACEFVNGQVQLQSRGMESENGYREVYRTENVTSRRKPDMSHFENNKTNKSGG